MLLLDAIPPRAVVVSRPACPVLCHDYYMNLIGRQWFCKFGLFVYPFRFINVNSDWFIALK